MVVLLTFLFGDASLRSSLELTDFSSVYKWFLKVISKRDKQVGNSHVTDLRAQFPKVITWKGNKDMDSSS